MKKICKSLHRILFVKKNINHSDKYYRFVDFFNRFSLIFHALMSFGVIFAVEWISRRDFVSAIRFLDDHSWAFLYNSFIVFVSLTFVYLFKRRAFARVIIMGFWTILGIVNGLILSNRVTPFGYTDIKCIPELFAMENTNYFTAEQATIVVLGLLAFLICLILLFTKGPRYNGPRHFAGMTLVIVLLIFVGVPLTTNVAKSTNVVASYYANIAQGYENYGFVYSFTSSVLDRGMKKPDDYTEENVMDVYNDTQLIKSNSTVDGTNGPNVICVLLESFTDPDDINFLTVNEGDPVPTFHYLEENYSTGHLTVPVVGAGTANTEFEVLTGMTMKYFGTGEYPYKTILKQTDCESIASDLHNIGYATHVVHNNGGNFYSRANAFSMMGFDTFTSKELMDITEYTPLGSWASDDILVSETIKTLDATPNQADFSYVITVSTHGDYPKEKVLDNPKFTVSGVEDEGMANAWTYYVNQLNAADRFISSLIEELSKRDEPTVVVMFGDHLPTMGLEDSDMATNDIYKTKYITWNNMGLAKQDADLYAYQLLAATTNSVGIHEGTIFSYHQTHSHMFNQDSYMHGLNLLQYDLLYGDRYVYGGEDKYPASSLIMGIDPVTITNVGPSTLGTQLFIYGQNFTNWSRVYVNDSKVSTTYISSTQLAISMDDIEEGDTITVYQMGSSDTKFRRSENDFVYHSDAQNNTETITQTPEDGITTDN